MRPDENIFSPTDPFLFSMRFGYDLLLPQSPCFLFLNFLFPSGRNPERPTARPRPILPRRFCVGLGIRGGPNDKFAGPFGSAGSRTPENAQVPTIPLPTCCMCTPAAQQAAASRGIYSVYSNRALQDVFAGQYPVQIIQNRKHKPAPRNFTKNPVDPLAV